MILIIHAYFLITFEIFASDGDGADRLSIPVRLEETRVDIEIAGNTWRGHGWVRGNEALGSLAHRGLHVAGLGIVSLVKISSSYHLLSTYTFFPGLY
jgi:hypothetical protein|tara:strand:+ start:8724 stop:9014 length:291 start_codon:yes stop_codon:yes gene_type:complete